MNLIIFIVVDFSVQAVVSTILYKFFPNDPIIGEEDAERLRGDAGKELREKVLSLANSVLDDPLDETEVMMLRCLFQTR